MRQRGEASDGRQPFVDPPSEHLTDGLLLAAGRGDLVAYADFYDKTASAVFRALRGMLGEPDRAERATERVYLRLWSTAPRFDPTGMSAWSLLMLIARRELVVPLCETLTQPAGASVSPINRRRRR